MKKILYFSTNNLWSGSEILWFQSAQLLINSGYSVGVATFYERKELDELNSTTRFNLNDRFKTSSFIDIVLNKIANKFNINSNAANDEFLSFLKSFNPDLILISQGNNLESLNYQKLFLQHNFRYCTLTQLVTEVHWLYINNDSLKELCHAYECSKRNFFISAGNLKLHYQMMGQTFSNSELVYNPFKKDSILLPYPQPNDSYNFAFIGRLECFHKGLDILLYTISENKWRNRPITVNIYGDGPHLNWLKSTITYLQLTNVVIKGYNADIKSIWENNHILVLPSRMEGQSLSLIECLKFGRTAVVTNVGGASEIIEDNVTGFIADHTDKKSFEEALERAWVLRDNWANMGIMARNRVEQIYPNDPADYFNSKLKVLFNGIDN